MAKQQEWKKTRKITVNLPVRVVEEFAKRYGSRSELITLAVTQYYHIDSVSIDSIVKLPGDIFYVACPVCKSPIIKDKDMEPKVGFKLICEVCHGFISVLSQIEKDSNVMGPHGIGSKIESDDDRVISWDNPLTRPLEKE